MGPLKLSKNFNVKYFFNSSWDPSYEGTFVFSLSGDGEASTNWSKCIIELILAQHVVAHAMSSIQEIEANDHRRRIS